MEGSSIQLRRPFRPPFFFVGFAPDYGHAAVITLPPKAVIRLLGRLHGARSESSHSDLGQQSLRRFRWRSLRCYDCRDLGFQVGFFDSIAVLENVLDDVKGIEHVFARQAARMAA